MNKVKHTISQYALNDEKILKRTHTSFGFGLKLVSALALGLVMMLAVLPYIQPQQTMAFVATIRVEINPSFDIKVNQDDEVLDIIALNDDALGFDKTAYIGLPLSEVVDALIAFAIEAGFIDEEALESDVVTISVVVDEDDDEDIQEAVDNLGRRLKAHLETLEEGSKVDIVFIKATLRELFEAQGKDIPLGLYVIQGQRLLDDGTLVPMREYLASERGKELDRVERAERFELRALERNLERLRERGEDVEELEDEIKEGVETPRERLNTVRERVKERLNRKE